MIKILSREYDENATRKQLHPSMLIGEAWGEPFKYHKGGMLKIDAHLSSMQMAELFGECYANTGEEKDPFVVAKMDLKYPTGKRK